MIYVIKHRPIELKPRNPGPFRWNSTSWDEFSRKWNKPVHQFLLRHVYASTMRSYKLSKTSAMFITFMLSAAVHELVMVIVTQKIRSVWNLVQSTICM